MYTLEVDKAEMKQVEFEQGRVVPVKRNSHSVTARKDGEVAYVFGGANEDGPRNDMFRVDLHSLDFANVKVQTKKLPQLEMHTAHLYKSESKLLLVGGRGLFPGQGGEPAFQNTLISVDVDNGKVEVVGALPADLAAHVSALVDDKYLVVYGGTNGLRFFDSVLRYSIPEKKWTLMTKQPKHCEMSRFFQEGRISCASCVTEDMFIIFGGSSVEKDCNDFLVLPLAHLRDDANFSEINEIM